MSTKVENVIVETMYDNNTKFFHKTDNVHKRQNYIDELLMERTKISDPEEINEDIISFYQN